MDVNLLVDIGLTKVQAETYIALVERGASTAPEIAKKIDESRTNAYKVLGRLVQLGLAVKDESGTRIRFAATSPVALEQFIQKQAEQVRQRERRISAELPHLLSYYFEHSERPSIRYFEGADGLAQINKDQLLTNKPLKFIRSLADADFLTFAGLHKMRNSFPRFGIPRETIIQDYLSYKLPEDNRMPVEKSDRYMLLKRTWIDAKDYTAPVEWAVYGDKLSIVQYGEQAMGMVIESAPIAEAFRQLYSLLDEGIRRRPDYHLYPKREKYTAIPDAAKKSQFK